MLRGSVRANAKVSKADITAVQSFVHYTRFQNFKTFNLKLVHPALVGHLGASYQLTLIVPKHCVGSMYCAITMATVRVDVLKHFVMLLFTMTSIKSLELA